MANLGGVWDDRCLPLQRRQLGRQRRLRPEPDCGGSGASQLTYACTDCDLGPNTALSFSFHYSCQSLLLEAAAVPAYPAGAASLVVAAAGATAAAPGGGGLLTALTWEAPPLLTQCRDNVSAGGVASKRGYAFTLSSVAPLRPPLPVGGAGCLLVRPTAATLNLTIALPLSPTFVTTSLTPLVPWTQLLANIVGLSGVISVVGVLFSAVEKKLTRGDGGKGGPLAAGNDARGSEGGVDSQFERVCALVKLANEHSAVAAARSAEATALQQSLARALSGGASLAADNPLLRASCAATADRKSALPAASVAAIEAAPPLATVWHRHSDGEDVWCTTSAGDPEWELPEGAVHEP